MRRILYLLLSNGGLQGGHKMIVRHVETLRDLGFDAHVYIGQGSVAPTWFEHRAPLLPAEPVRPDDIVVLPDDAPEAMLASARAPFESVVICQNPYYFASKAFSNIEDFPADRFPTVIAVAPGLAQTLRRLFPAARVEVVRCFADERRFRPAGAKQTQIAYSPRKRAVEAAAIRNLFARLHPAHGGISWREIVGVPEAAAAEVFAASSLHLSLSRLESVGMTPLEAMASGCLCAGFTGVGGLEYATPDNGFWVAEDDCLAAADALAEAVALTNAGGPGLQRRLEAGYETARAWSYAAFRAELEAAWMRLAPDARVKNGPLDPA